MGHPYYYPDQRLTSSCCGATPWGHVDDDDRCGICSDCKEHATFKTDEEYEAEENINNNAKLRETKEKQDHDSRGS